MLLMLQREADERERQRREAERREIQLKAAKEKLDQLRQTTIGAKVFNDMDEEVRETFINFLFIKFLHLTFRPVHAQLLVIALADIARNWYSNHFLASLSVRARCQRTLVGKMRF